MTTKVTVLMAVYNGATYLRDCIESVLFQTYKDFEFLIIDDGSTDATRAMVKSYKDDRICLIANRKNLSQVTSLNIGLDNAQGEYIARIDQDDMMMQDRLRKQVDFLNRRLDISVVGTWGEVIDEKGISFVRSKLPIRNEEIVGTALFGGYFLMHPSAMFRKDAIIAVGKYNEAFSYAEDYDLWTRLLLKRYKLANIPEFLIKFRYHKKSASRQFNELQFKNAYNAVSNFIRAIIGDLNLNRLCNMLINAGLMNREYWSDKANVISLNETIGLLDLLLTKTTQYFNLTRREAYFMKKIFCNRLLNFVYESCYTRKTAGMELYSYCLKNSFFILEKPKLYLYPLKASI